MDRRTGAERRSTLERRSYPTRRHAYTESPGEHLRNALQLLDQLTAVSELDGEARQDLTAALDGLRRALGMLERRTGP